MSGAGTGTDTPPVRRPTAVQAVEAAIVARLKERLPGRVSRIESFPDRPEQYDFPDTDTAAAFVYFEGADYAPTSDSPRAVYSPRRTCRWRIILLVRSLNGAEGGVIGAYEALEEIRLALQGQSFAGATAMMSRREALEEQRAGVWRWSMEFTNALPAIAEAEFERSGFYSEAREA